MKVSYKSLLHLVSGLLIGVFVGSLIVKQELVFLSFWSILGTIGSISASIAALYIANQSWNKAQQDKYDTLLRAEYNNSLQATNYFRYLSRISTPIAKGNSAFRSNRNFEKTLNEIVESWSYILKNQNMAQSVIQISNWKDRKAVDGFQLILIVLDGLKGRITDFDEPSFKKALAGLSDLLHTFWYISHSNCISHLIQLEIMGAHSKKKINELTLNQTESNKDAENSWLEWKKYSDSVLSDLN